MTKEKFTNFSVAVYGNLEPYNDTLSKGRCRIFYKGKNRNGSYISDEFAEKLLSTVAYAPVKGIYSTNSEDYTDHGAERDLGKIYGIVPENYNLKWEKHLDDDGVEREYACVDVLIYTGLYKEASNIVGKAQSMELYAPSIQGSWVIIDGVKYYKFQEGSFLGLQVLGKETEPCFEGAGFFTLLKDLEAYSLAQKSKEENKMDKKEIFNLSDDEKYGLLWDALNANGYKYCVASVYDTYAITYNCEAKEYMRVYYTKDNTNNTVEITDKEKVYILDITEKEKAALDALRSISGDTFEKIKEQYQECVNQKTNYEEICSEKEAKIKDLDIELSTLRQAQEKSAQTIDELNAQIANLQEYKLDAERKEKAAEIAKYNHQLSEELLSKFTDSIDNYSFDELKKELALTYVENTPNIFSKADSQLPLIPKDRPHTGLEAILDKYEKRENGGKK